MEVLVVARLSQHVCWYSTSVVFANRLHFTITVTSKFALIVQIYDERAVKSQPTNPNCFSF